MQSLRNTLKHNRVMQERPQQLHMFTLSLRQYVYSSELHTFVAVPAMSPHLPTQICKALDALRLIAKGTYQ